MWRLSVIFVIAATPATPAQVADTFINPLDGGWPQACPAGNGFDKVPNCITQDFGRATDNTVAPFNAIDSGWFDDHYGYHLGYDILIPTYSAQDISARNFKKEYAPANGVVKWAATLPPNGYVVVIEHQLPASDPDGPTICSVFYHMLEPIDGGVKWTAPQSVSVGQLIGYASPYSTKDVGGAHPHQHFGIRRGAFAGGLSVVETATGNWFYPGYTTIFHGGVKQDNQSDPVHEQVISEWLNPYDFLVAHGAMSALSPAFGTVTVRVVLDGAAWPPSGAGPVKYTIAGPAGQLGGTSVAPLAAANLQPGMYTLTLLSGGPPKSTLSSIGPCGTLTRGPTCSANLPAGDVIAFTLQFISNAGPPPAPTLTQLTNATSRDYFPSFRPDGSKILFSSNRDNVARANDIWQMNPDGSQQTEIVHVDISTPTYFNDPGLFPNVKEAIGSTGDLIVTEAQAHHEVMRVALSQATSFPIVRTVEDGSDAFFSDLLLVPGGLNVGSVGYSSATQNVAWIGYIGGGSQYQLRTAPLGQLTGEMAYSVGSVLLTTSSDGSHGGIAFSPNGQQIVASLCLNSCSAQGKGTDLYILDATSGQIIQRLTTDGDTGVSSQQPRWSPNGQLICFVSNKTGNNEIWIIHPDGTGVERLTTNGLDNSGPSWSPDSVSVVFATNNNGGYSIWLASGVK